MESTLSEGNNHFGNVMQLGRGRSDKEARCGVWRTPHEKDPTAPPRHTARTLDAPPSVVEALPRERDTRTYRDDEDGHSPAGRGRRGLARVAGRATAVMGNGRPLHSPLVLERGRAEGCPLSHHPRPAGSGSLTRSPTPLRTTLKRRRARASLSFRNLGRGKQMRAQRRLFFLILR